MMNLKMFETEFIKTDKTQYLSRRGENTFFLAEVRGHEKNYYIVGNEINIQEIVNDEDEYEDFVNARYGSLEGFEEVYPPEMRKQVLAEMYFELIPPPKLYVVAKKIKTLDEATELLDTLYGKRRLFVDMDGTLTTFTPATMETLRRKGYFASLPPHEKVVEAIGYIAAELDNVEVFILTAVLDTPFAKKEKREWLRKHLPQIDDAHIIFVPCGADKKQFIPGGKGAFDFLLDDYSANLHQWGKGAIKLRNAINGTKGTSVGMDYVEYQTEPKQLVDKILYFMNPENYYGHAVMPFEIWQITMDKEGLEFLFQPLEAWKDRGKNPKRRNYEKVYTGNVECPVGFGDFKEAIEDLYLTFNVGRPKGYTARSLSVSDVIVFKQWDKETAMYVQPIGFEEIDFSLR